MEILFYITEQIFTTLNILGEIYCMISMISILYFITYLPGFVLSNKNLPSEGCTS